MTWRPSSSPCATEGTDSIQRPWRKNVARASAPASTSNSRSIPTAFGRSACSASNVSATRMVMPRNLLLDAGNDDAPRERSLEDDKQEYRDEQRHHVPGLNERRLRVVDALEALQPDLQRDEFVMAGEVDERLEVVVPAVHKREDRDGDDDRPCLRQDHGSQDPNCA